MKSVGKAERTLNNLYYGICDLMVGAGGWVNTKLQIMTQECKKWHKAIHTNVWNRGIIVRRHNTCYFSLLFSMNTPSYHGKIM